jgi:hypothetical protein
MSFCKGEEVAFVRRILMAVFVLIPRHTACAQEAKHVTGRVLDGAGEPVSGATVAPLWGANGLDWDQVAAVRSTEPEKLWQHEGEMAPWGTVRAVTDGNGRFSIAPPDRKNALLAYDRGRQRGAFVVFDLKQPEKPVEVRLQPLVRIFGATRLAGTEAPLKWSCTYLNTPYDDKSPLLSRRMAICGSFKGRFAFLVPPGTYLIRASSDDPTSETVEEQTVTITADQKELDLGTLVLRPYVGLAKRIERAKANGTWGNYKENFGKQPPRWHLTDARGVAKDAELADFRGKWVVLYFWSPGCAPCLGKQLPELMAFYETHKSKRDRFEILAFCCDFSETLKSIVELDQRLQPVKKGVWGGKDLPFPVLLDNTFQTYERFGLEGNGVSNKLLIDPDGKLVEGDLRTLEMKLRNLR